MKTLRLAKILFLSLALCAFLPVCFAQQTNTPPPAAEITKETDHLPFMKNEQAAATEEPGTGSLLAKTLGAMLLICGLIFFGAWGLKKFGFGVLKPSAARDAPDLTILSSVSLGSGRTISTVRFGERVLLVGSTAQAFTLLADDTLNESTALDISSPRSVAELLSEENISFENELNFAQNKLAFFDGGGQS